MGAGPPWGVGRQRGLRPSRLFPALGLDARAVSTVELLGFRLAPVSAVSCAGATFLLEAGARRVRQVPSLSLSVPPLYNGDKSAEPTGSLRAFSDNTGVSPWPCGYCGVVSACMNSGHFFSLLNLLLGDKQAKEKRKTLVRSSLSLLVVMIRTQLYQCH